MKKEQETKKKNTHNSTKKHQTQLKIIASWRKVIQNM